ncbi:MAG: beta-lactamase family protein [Proteobacteria bacterium]|nr:beta-lactamase family protein [Pseudomonadota bacterium]
MNSPNNYLSRLLLFSLLIGSCASRADVCDFSAVDTSVENLLQLHPQIPGLGLQIGYPDEIIYEKYWGQYDSSTIVTLASATKLLSGVTLMALVDKGLIDLDQEVSTYLPQFTGTKGQMTVRQMFSHTAGMPTNNLLVNSSVLNPFNGLTLEEAVDILACCEPLRYQPGTGFAYGGSSMHIAGRVAEVVSDGSWIEVFNQHLAIPLGINSMDYSGLGATQNYRTSGSARSSMPDYAKVLNMLLNKGRYQSTRVLSEQAVTTLITDNVGDSSIFYAPPQVDGEVRYGIGGWLRLDDEGITTNLSSPGAFGFTPWVDYDLNYYAVFMVQDSNSRMAPLVLEIRDQIRQILTDNWCGLKPQELTDELGLWYDPERSGHGFEIQKVGSNYSGVFYTFTESGQAEWYLLAVDDLIDKLSGSIIRVENRGNSEILEPVTEPVGSFMIKFNPVDSSTCTSTENNSRAEIIWNINDEQAVWCLQPLLTVNSRAKTNPNGWWWNGSGDSGWGFDIYANEASEFRVVYYYDASGNPIWSLGLSDTESENFTMKKPVGYCRSCNKIPLLLENIGQFTGRVDASFIDNSSNPILSLNIEGWSRPNIIPQIFSNPAY